MSLLLLLKANRTWAETADGGVAVGGPDVAVQWNYGDDHFFGAVEVGGDEVVPVTHWFNDTDGGVEVGGDEVRITADTFGISGGVKVGGDPVGVDFGYVTDGGVQVGGDDAVLDTGFSEEMAYGGIAVGGDGSGTPILESVFETDGGVKVGGDGSTLVNAYFDETDGGVKVGGDGTGNPISVYYQNTDNAGGVKVGGDGVGVVTNTSGDGDTWTNGTARHRGPTNQRAILIALRNHIVASGIVQDHQASISSEPIEDTFAPTGEPYIVVAPGNKDVDQGFFAGGGRESDLQVETIEVRLYQRSALDRLQEQTIWTTQAIRGAYSLARNLAAQLHELDLVDGAGTLIVAEPIRILTTGRPVKIRSVNGWGYIPTIIAVSFTSDLLVEAAGA